MAGECCTRFGMAVTGFPGLVPDDGTTRNRIYRGSSHEVELCPDFSKGDEADVEFMHKHGLVGCGMAGGNHDDGGSGTPECSGLLG